MDHRKKTGEDQETEMYLVWTCDALKWLYVARLRKVEEKESISRFLLFTINKMKGQYQRNFQILLKTSIGYY